MKLSYRLLFILLAIIIQFSKPAYAECGRLGTGDSVFHGVEKVILYFPRFQFSDSLNRFLPEDFKGQLETSLRSRFSECMNIKLENVSLIVVTDSIPQIFDQNTVTFIITGSYESKFSPSYAYLDSVVFRPRIDPDSALVAQMVHHKKVIIFDSEDKGIISKKINQFIDYTGPQSDLNKNRKLPMTF